MNQWQKGILRWALPSSVVALSATLSVLLLVVLPIVHMSGGAQAQPMGPGGPPAAGQPGMPGPGGAPGMPGMGGAPGMPGMGGAPGMPGMGGAPGMPGMGGAPGMPGAPGAGGGGAAPAQPAEPEKIVEPLEPYRDDPFLPVAGGVTEKREMPWVTRYGIDWSKQPIGVVFAPSGLPRPTRPPVRPTPPPPPPAEKFLRVSSIAWAGGQAMATYETPDGKSGVLKPGEFVGDWQVVEILRDRIKVKHRKTGEIQEVFLRPKEKLPPRPTTMPGYGGMPGQPGMMPTPGMVPGGGMMPMGPGGPAMGGQPGMPMPAPGVMPGGAAEPRVRPGGLLRPGGGGGQ